MNVKDWIEKLQIMPEDAEVYHNDGETGEWWSLAPELIDSEHTEFKRARKFSWLTVAEARPYVMVRIDSESSGVRLAETEKVNG
jgi:hypothetical protein